MSPPRQHLVPQQSRDVYSTLSELGVVTAKEIATKLAIMPNTVYRAMRPLLALGVAEELKGRPIRYRVVPSAAAEEWYVRSALQAYRRDFSSKGKLPSNLNDTLPSLSFIKDRRSLRIITEQEAKKATKSIDFITSGHTVADSTIQVYRKAAYRSVRLRALVENDPKRTDVDVEAYRIIGAETRFLPNTGMRLFIFDETTAVLTSYDQQTPMRAFGIRFSYPPVAQQLTELFEQRWTEGSPIAVS
jgi:hypothetical protein